MGPMRGLAGSFLTRRMMASRLLLASVAVTIAITAALTAALVSFAAEGLPRAVPRQLGHSSSLAVTISISGDAGTVARDTRAVGASIPLEAMARALAPTGGSGGVQRPFLKLPRRCGAKPRGGAVPEGRRCLKKRSSQSSR